MSGSYTAPAPSTAGITATCCSTGLRALYRGRGISNLLLLRPHPQGPGVPGLCRSAGPPRLLFHRRGGAEPGQRFPLVPVVRPQLPIFGRDHIATFERALIEDKDTWKEPKNPYYRFNDDEALLPGPAGCLRPAQALGAGVINGHMPVRVKEGEDPRKAGGPAGGYRRRVLPGLSEADRHRRLYHVLQLPRYAHRLP